MEIDVVDLVRPHARIVECQGHRARRLLAVLVETHAVVRLAGRAIARDLGVDLCPAGEGGLALLDDHHPRPFAENEAVPVPGEGARPLRG